ncbi:hypothetical protein [Microbacterium schleiferi]|jgi:hypothetical protein|uniref:hypothetical protein n=1 Tax=Microbacterium schleiferi TaxID=69362 RepID=UPI0035C7B7EB
MADARIPEQYLTDKRILRLTDSERSSFFMALVWSISNRTDGRIERGDLPLIPTFAPAAIPGLVRWECWVVDGADAWRIADYARWQTTRSEFEVLDNARRRDREKKARQRAKAKESPGGQSPGNVPGDMTGKARQGQARQETGKENDEVEADPTTGEIADWATRVPGEPDSWMETEPGRWEPVGSKGAA